MYERVFLSTYHIKIKNKKESDDQILDRFNGQSDFFQVLYDFLMHAYQNPPKTGNDEEKNTNLSFTLLEPPITLLEERVIYGFIETAIIGQPIKIKNHVENKEVFKGNRDTDASYKTVFFYCKLPIGNKKGYLILQRRARYGVKGAFTRLMRTWMREQGFLDSRLDIRSVYNAQVFFNMLDKGKLKKINFVLNYVPASIEAFVKEGEKERQEPGQTITTFSSKTSLSNYWKRFALSKYTAGQSRALVEVVEDVNSEVINDIDNSDPIKYDELAIELELNGVKKTFYVHNKGRVAPEREVSADLTYNTEGEPTLDSLLKQCNEIVADTFEINKR